MKLLEIIGPGVVARGDYPVPEKIQKWIPWMTKTVQHAQAQLSNDRVLSQKNKQNFRSLTKKASDKVQTPDDDTPVWGRILFISTALMMIVNKISAAAGAMAVALADKDGDGDLDFDDFNEQVWIPKIDKNWSGAIPATIIYNKNKRKFYEQSFTEEELQKEVQSFLKS